MSVPNVPKKRGRPRKDQSAKAKVAHLKVVNREPDSLSPAADRIYDTIHEAVLDHRLPPGTKLKEVALAELFGVTRPVIRKVLLRLAHIKLVVIRPNRGAIVATPTVEESRDLFRARCAIETAVVDTLTSKITNEQINDLRAMITREQDTYRGGDTRLGLKLSVEFHRVLANLAGNAVLAEFLDQLLSRTPLVVLAHQGQRQQRICNLDEHSQILDAMADGEAERAVRLMREHLDSLQGMLNLHQDGEQETDLAQIFRLMKAWPGIGKGA
jgi:DNA-binding GntR family transcriptional regulator